MRNIIAGITGIIIFIGTFILAGMGINEIVSGLTGNTYYIMKIILWLLGFSFITVISITISLLVIMLIKYKK